MTSKIYTPQEIAACILASIRGTITEDQAARLECWLEECEANRRFYKQIKEEHYQIEELQEFARYDSRQDWQKVKAARARKPVSVFYRLLPYAALLVLALGIWYLSAIRQSPEVKLAVLQDTIQPGYAHARLILLDGSQLSLQARNQVIRQGNFVNQNAILSYDSTSTATPVERHRLQVPRGGEYHLVLADGTHIWLNAETEISYPDRFTDTSRTVELNGEAYFEVAKDPARPFYVHTEGMLIKVTGTSFNVRAYRNGNTQTTLVEGRVTVDCDNRSFQVQPGEQVTLTASGALLSKTEYIRNYIGWRENRFVFEDKPLEEVLHDLERWYDIQVDIRDKQVRDLCFTGNLPKYENIQQVLYIIELATCTKCRLQGRHLTVTMEE